MMVANAFRPPQYQLSSSRSCLPSEFGPAVTAVTRARNWLHCCVFLRVTNVSLVCQWGRMNPKLEVFPQVHPSSLQYVRSPTSYLLPKLTLSRGCGGDVVALQVFANFYNWYESQM